MHIFLVYQQEKKTTRGNLFFMVALIQALSHQTPPVKRLLDQALTWEDADAGVLPAARPCRLARRLRPDELDELIEGYLAGKTVFQLAEQFGIERRAVGRHLRRRGIDTRPPALTETGQAKAAELYQDGWSLAKIATHFGISADTVNHHLRQAGVELRARGWPRRQG